MNTSFIGGSNNSQDGENTSDNPATPQNQNTTAETSGSIKVICKWRAATCDSETGVWTDDGSIPTDKALRLTVESQVSAYGVVCAPSNQSPPSSGAVEVDVKGLGTSSDTQLIEHLPDFSDPILSRNKFQTKQKVYVLPVPEPTAGEYKVEFVVDGISAKSHITTGSHGVGLAIAGAYYTIKSIDSLNVYITGNAPTYKKVTNYAELPDSPNPNTPGKDLGKINTNLTPYNGPDSGPWAVLCEPDNHNGKMVAHKAAEWNQSPDCTGWYGGGYWYAHTPNLNGPIYQWSLSGGSPTEHFQTTLSEGFPTVTAVAGLMGEGLGGLTKDGVFLSNSPRGDNLNGLESKLTLTATDQQGYTGTDDYTVKWHAIDEDWHEGDPTFLTPAILNLGPISTNGNAFSYPNDNEVDIDYRQGAFVASGLTSIGAVFFAAAAPEATVVANIIRIVGGAIGVTANFIPASTPPQTTQVGADFSDFKNDFFIGGDANVTGTVEIFVQEPRTEQELTQSVFDAANSADCAFWGDGHLKVQLKVTFKKKKENWDSDFFTANGYAGRKASTYTHTVQAVKERTWTYDDRYPGGQ